MATGAGSGLAACNIAAGPANARTMLRTASVRGVGEASALTRHPLPPLATKPPRVPAPEDHALCPGADAVPDPTRHLRSGGIEGPAAKQARTGLHLGDPPWSSAAPASQEVCDEGDPNIGVGGLVVAKLPTGMNGGAEIIDHSFLGPRSGAPTGHIVGQSRGIRVGRMPSVIPSDLLAHPGELVGLLLDAERFPVHQRREIRPASTQEFRTNAHFVESFDGAEPPLVQAVYRAVLFLKPLAELCSVASSKPSARPAGSFCNDHGPCAGWSL